MSTNNEPINDPEITRWKRDEIAACITIDQWLSLVEDAARNRHVHEFRLACAIQTANGSEAPDGGLIWPIWRVAARHFIGKSAEHREYLSKLDLAVSNLRALERSLKPKRPKKNQE